MTHSKRKNRLRLLLTAAAALGSTSAVLSGTLAALGTGSELSRPISLV
jgi:hypothetical protein